MFLPRGLTSLQYPNFRLLWAAQWARGIGIWTQLIATPLLVLAAGGTALDVGLAQALMYGPLLVLGPIGGVIADRVPKRNMVAVLHVFLALNGLAFFAIVWWGVATIPAVLLLTAVAGIANAVEMPTRSSFTAELVRDEHLTNAVALMMVAFNGSRIVGPAIAGIIAATFGIAACFALGFAASIVTSVLITLIDLGCARPSADRRRTSVRAALAGGWSYVMGTPRVRHALSSLGVFAFFGNCFQTLAPVYAVSVLGLDASGFGFLIAIMGIGALAGALSMTTATQAVAQRLLFAAPLVFAILLAILGLNSAPLLAYVVVAPLGFLYLLTTASANLAVQATVPHDLRGRTMGIYMTVMDGGIALGAIAAGMLASLFGAGTAILIGAIGLAAMTLVVRASRQPALLPGAT